MAPTSIRDKITTHKRTTSTKRIPRSTWSQIQASYVQGVTAGKLAEIHGVKESTIRQRAMRSGWSKHRQTLKQTVSEATKSLVNTRVKDGVEKEVDDWLAKVKKILNRRLDHLMQLDPAELPLKELDRLTQIVETTDKGGRRALGLDKQENTTINNFIVVSAGSLARSASTGDDDQEDIIDVEPTD